MNTKNPVTEEQIKIVLHEYIELGHGQSATMKAANINLLELRDILTSHGYKLRNRHEAIIAANKGRNLLKNQQYFQCENENMAWLLGFLAADGSIEKDRNIIKLSLSTVDKEILEKIRKEIQLESEVKDYQTSEGYNVSKIQWSSEQHKKDLAKYGITPQKTFKLIPPYQLNKKFWKDYIRGFWDGDGSITLLKNNYNSLEWQLVSGTKEILEFIVNYFYEEYNIPKVNINFINRHGNNVYTILYSTNASKKIYEIFYSNPNCLSLKRKKDKYTTIIQNSK